MLRIIDKGASRTLVGSKHLMEDLGLKEVNVKDKEAKGYPKPDDKFPEICFHATMSF